MKTAIITGSEGQLGKVFVEELLRLDFHVIGIDILEESNNEKIQYIQADITSKSSIEAKLSSSTINKVDLLINNAGTSIFTPFEERTEEELDLVIGVNIKGLIFMTQTVFNYFLKPQKSGCIVNIASIYGLVAGDMNIYAEGDRRTPEIYGATKASVINLTKYFAAYMAPLNIRVNAISPGGVFNYQDNRFVQKYSNKVPLGRMANSSELLSTLKYLISEESTYVTGENIVVDGGLTTW